MKATRCTAKSKTSGTRCKRPAIPGGTVCRFHGGAAPQVQRAAKERIMDAAMHALTGFEKEAAALAKAGVRGDKVRFLVGQSLLHMAGFKPVTPVQHSGEVKIPPIEVRFVKSPQQ